MLVSKYRQIGLSVQKPYRCNTSFYELHVAWATAYLVTFGWCNEKIVWGVVDSHFTTTKHGLLGDNCISNIYKFVVVFMALWAIEMIHITIMELISRDGYTLHI